MYIFIYSFFSGSNKKVLYSHPTKNKQKYMTTHNSILGKKLVFEGSYFQNVG